MNIWIISGIVIFAFALYFNLRKTSSGTDIVLLFVSAVVFGIGIILSDEYLNSWDERYHALVAQNMKYNPLRPTLYREHLFDHMDHSPWWRAHIWMHKGPVFSWIGSLGLQIFGHGFLGLRIGSLLMVILCTFSIYKISRRLYPSLSFVISMLIAFQPMLWLLASGRLGMDHNDIAFIAFLTASFWCFIELRSQSSLKWLIGIGLFTAAAVLTKWFAGYLVFCIWGLHLLLFHLKVWIDWRNLIIAFLISIVPVIIWFAYCYVHFSEVLLLEWKLNGASHLFEVLDGHETKWDFHFQIWKTYLSLLTVFSIVGLARLFRPIKTEKDQLLRTSTFCILAVTIFFSIAQTRMPAYTIILLGPAAILAMNGLYILSSLRLRKWQKVLALLLLSFINFQQFFVDFQRYKPNDQYIAHQIKIRDFYTGLRKKLSPSSVIFNTPDMEFVDVMYYTDLLAYEFPPSAEDLKILEKKGYQAVVILDKDFNLEDYQKAEHLSHTPYFLADY